MENTKVITTWQLILLISSSRLMIAYTYLPVVNTPPANQDAWIVGFIAAVYTTVLSIPLLYLVNKFRGIPFTKMLEMITGSFVGKVLAIVFSLFFMFCNTACFVIGIIFVNSSIFPETPPFVLMLFFIIPCVYIVYKGASVMGKVAQLAMPYVIITILLFFLLALNKMNFEELKPILADSTFLQLNYGGFLIGSRFSDFLVVAALAFELKDNVSINKSFFGILGLFTALFVLIIIPTITTLGIDSAQHMWNPYYTFTKTIDVYEFIQRIEALNMTAWMTALIVKMSLYLYVTAKIFSHVFGTKSHNAFTIPLAITIVCVSLFSGINKSSVVDLLRSYKVFPWIAFAYLFVLPLLILIIFLIRKKKLTYQIEQAKLKPS